MLFKASHAFKPPTTHHGLILYMDIKCVVKFEKGLVTDLVPWRAWGGEHLFTRENSIGTRHEAQNLFGFIKGVPTRCESDDSRWQHDASRRDGSGESVERNRL